MFAKETAKTGKARKDKTNKELKLGEVACKVRVIIEQESENNQEIG